MRNFVITCTLLTFLISCDSNQIFDQYESLSGGWQKDNILTFNLPQLDSLQQYNLFINVRNDNTYKFSNLFLISEMKFPNGKVLTDTLEYEMAAPDGSWLGSGFTDVKENKLWYRENVNFEESGTYEISIQHAMRMNGSVGGVEVLQGIIDIGFRIEKQQKP